MTGRVERLEHAAPNAAAWAALSIAAAAAMMVVHAPAWAWMALRVFLQL